MRTVARHIMSINPAVVVAVHRVVGGSMGSSVSTSAGGAALAQVVSVNPTIIVAVHGVVGGSVGASADGASVVGAVRAALAQVVSINPTIVVAVQGVLSVKIAVTGGRVVVSGLVVKTLSTSKGADATNVLGDTLKLVVALLTAGQGSTLGLELLHGHGRQSSGLMVSGLVVVYLVNRNSGVNNGGLDGLLLDYGLDSLVDVVVDVLSANSRCNALAVGGLLNAPLVGKTSLVLDEGPLGGVSVTVVELAVLDCSELGSVCLGEDLAVLDGLNSAVVVILMDLLVDGSIDLLMYMGLDNLVVYSGSNSLVDSGVVVAGPAHELGDSCLCFVHFEVVVV